jgi:pyruvate ferredoxin oxidoreductase delta subunit
VLPGGSELEKEEQMAVTAIEVIYRGIFQKSLSRNICRTIVLAARKEGKIGTAFGRYGDSPERNGIPAKYFAVVADDSVELEETLAKYEPKEVEVSIVVDDTLCKGVESWAWYGLQPINELTVEGGTVLVTSIQSNDDLIEDMHVKDVPYNLAIVKGAKSFSGLWVYKDDHTDMRVLGALAKVCPQLVGLDAYKETVAQQWDDELKVGTVERSYNTVTQYPVEPGQGNPAEPFKFEKPGWVEMQDAIVIPGIEVGGGFRGGEGGFQATRNEVFKKWSTRTMRPVINFETCTKCTLCWLQCPDSCFDVTPEELYDADMESCCGCGVCEEVCPVPDCITMVNEESFSDNASQHDHWKKDRDGYMKWLEEKITIAKAEKDEVGRSHGFHSWGTYEKQIEITGVGDDD